MSVTLSRRGFLGSLAAGGAVLVVGVNGKGAWAATADSETVLNPFVTIDGKGVVTVIVKHFEMGQGTTTGLTTLIAEELDADWPAVRTAFAPADQEKYKNLFFGSQGTGGSTAMANSFMQYRQAGAAARDLLIRAAAQAWKVEPASISIKKGILKAGDKSGHFGDFVAAAAALEPAADPKVKDPADFTLIGKQKLVRKDNDNKTDGSAVFATDVHIEGMVYAALVRSPQHGGSLKSFDAAGAKDIPGFIDAKALPNGAGVAVFGENTWAAFQARDAITAEWDLSKAESRSSADMKTEILALLDKPQHQAVKETSTDSLAGALSGAAKIVESSMVFPWLAHAPMEPMCCVIEPTEDGVLLHDGCQFPAITHPTVAGILKLKPEQVKINTVYAGGSFGRRANAASDYQAEAAMAFTLLGGKTPVKLVWSREDDIRGGYYRPLTAHKARIGLDADGKILGWDHRIASKSILKGTPFEPVMVHDGVDHTMVEGLSDSLYNIPSMAVGVSDFESPVPALWWRSVGHTHTAFAMETLIDQLASETGQDPVALRLSLLSEDDPKQKRLAGVIRAVRDLSGWEKGQKRGFAAHFSFNSFVAVVADVTVKEKEVHVDKLFMAVDCGVPVNPDIIRAQMEGGAGFGLGAILRNEITFDKGQVVEENFPSYPPLRMSDMPEIEVTIIPSTEAPTGVGEPGVPPTGPAVANALSALTGQRFSELPLTKAGFVFV